ncbi:MAG: proline iminopeptidase-family hydrolase [Pseudomonadota bacterium]
MTPMRTLVLLMAISLASCASTKPSLSSMPKSGFVEVPGGPVWYEVMSEGEGTPLVILHGGPGSTSCGYQRLGKLNDNRPVIRYDQLGTGRSGRPDDTSLWNRDRFVEELDALRDALGLEEIHLLGHSWGGSLAAYYFLETGGEGVRSLILSSPLISTPVWIRDANKLRKTLPQEVQDTLAFHEKEGTIDSGAYKQASDVFYDRFVYRGEAVEPFECPDAPWNSLIYNQMWGPTEFYATGSLSDFDLTPRLNDIDVPTLFMTGEFDEAVPESTERFANMVPGARFQVIPGVAHASLSRAPEQYREIVRAFLADVENSQSAEMDR